MTESDFSPEDAYKLFPTAYPLRPQNEEAETTTAAVAVSPTVAENGLDFFFGINGTYIFGESEDTIILPLLIGLIGICSFLSNGFVMFVIVAFSRMRSGPNLLLLNVSAADVVFMVFCVPTAIVNHATPAGLYGLPGAGVCKFVHYMIFVTVYVSVYSLVVSTVFQFFGDCMKSAESRGKSTLLSRGNAFITSVVIWTAFVLCHLNFLVTQEGAVFQEPFICLHSYVLPEATKIKTLWVTFLTCAFLLPLLTICALSAIILQRQRRKRETITSLRDGGVTTPLQSQYGGMSQQYAYEAAQNEMNDRRSCREITMVLMASMVIRAIFWLPIQIFVMVDIFGMAEITEVYRKTEMLGVCCAFAGTCVTPLLYKCLSRDFRSAYNETFRKVGWRCCVSDRDDDI